MDKIKIEYEQEQEFCRAKGINTGFIITIIRIQNDLFISLAHTDQCVNTEHADCRDLF